MAQDWTFFTRDFCGIIILHLFMPSRQLLETEEARALSKKRHSFPSSALYWRNGKRKEFNVIFLDFSDSRCNYRV